MSVLFAGLIGQNSIFISTVLLLHPTQNSGLFSAGPVYKVLITVLTLALLISSSHVLKYGTLFKPPNFVTFSCDSGYEFTISWLRKYMMTKIYNEFRYAFTYICIVFIISIYIYLKNSSKRWEIFVSQSTWAVGQLRLSSFPRDLGIADIPSQEHQHPHPSSSHSDQILQDFQQGGKKLANPTKTQTSKIFV